MANEHTGRVSYIYDIFMLISIAVSIIPLAFKEANRLFIEIDKITVTIFIVDYIMRFMTADFKIGKGIRSYIMYLFSPMAIIDLLSILPSLTLLNSRFKIFKIFRMLRSFRIFRVFKSIRYSKNVALICNVFKRQKEALIAVGGIALGYIIISALVIFNVEPETFGNFFDAVYWATVSLTTVGYGDIYPVTTIGRIVTIISSVFGIAIVALPAGIITAGLIEELHINDNKE